MWRQHGASPEIGRACDTLLSRLGRAPGDRCGLSAFLGGCLGGPEEERTEEKGEMPESVLAASRAQEAAILERFRANAAARAAGGA